MKKLSIMLIAGMILLYGCQPSTTPEVSETTPPTPVLSVTSTSAPTQTVVSESTVPASQPTPEISATLTEVLIVEQNRVHVQYPPGWYHSETEIADMQVYVYANQNLDEMYQETETLPEDFTAAAITISHLPEGTDPEALQQGLSANREQYNAQDLESMLILADQIGLIDLQSIEEVRFLTAEIGKIEHRDALRLEGLITPESSPAMHIQTWITWTENYFISIFEISPDAYWQSAQGYFNDVRESLQLP
jgi:hypothetical protein